MHNNRKAFTLTEIIIMLAIISIVIVALMQASNPFAPKFKTLYYYTFINVRKFGGEMVASSLNKSIDTDDVSFCNGLTDKLNIVGSDNVCTNFYEGTKALPFFNMAATDLDNPTFSISNGQRLYVSKRVEDLPMSYRVLTVDLNGKSKPNKFNQDIVPFLMFDTGEVMPIGPPAEDKDYLMVYGMIHNAETGKSTGTYVYNSKPDKFLTYREGYCLADYKSAYTDYCDSTAAFLNAITPDPACASGNPSTFCRVNLIKPLINVKI